MVTGHRSLTDHLSDWPVTRLRAGTPGTYILAIHDSGLSYTGFELYSKRPALIPPYNSTLLTISVTTVNFLRGKNNFPSIFLFDIIH